MQAIETAYKKISEKVLEEKQSPVNYEESSSNNNTDNGNKKSWDEFVLTQKFDIIYFLKVLTVMPTWNIGIFHSSVPRTFLPNLFPYHKSFQPYFKKMQIMKFVTDGKICCPAKFNDYNNEKDLMRHLKSVDKWHHQLIYFYCKALQKEMEDYKNNKTNVSEKIGKF